MKRFLSFFVALVLTLGVMAQTQHLKFQGIPLNGTISAFHQKLVAKGFKHDAVLSKGVGAGTRCFSGVCFNKEAMIGVYYIPKTKLVCGLSVSIEYTDIDDQKADFKRINNALAKKYPNAEVIEDEYEDKNIYVLDEGQILVYCELDKLYVMYYDGENIAKYEKYQEEEYIDDL
jgi:hypothetical protein